LSPRYKIGDFGCGEAFPAKEFVASMEGSEVDTIMKGLSEIAFRIKDQTRIPTSIKKNDDPI
jgi:hypothetical protein